MAIIDDQERQLEELRASAAGADLSALQPMAPLPPWAPDAAAQPQQPAEPMPDMPTVADKNAVERALEQGPAQPAQAVAPAPEQEPAATPAPAAAPKTRKEQLYEAMQGLGDRDAVEKQNADEVRRAKVGQALYALATGRQLGGDFFAPNVKDPDARLKSELLRSQVAKNLGEQRAAAEGKVKSEADRQAMAESNRALLKDAMDKGALSQAQFDALDKSNVVDPFKFADNQLKNVLEKNRLREGEERRNREQVYQQDKATKLYQVAMLKEKGAAATRAMQRLDEYHKRVGGADVKQLDAAFDVFDSVTGGALNDPKFAMTAELAKTFDPERMMNTYLSNMAPDLAKKSAEATKKFQEMLGKQGMNPEKAAAAVAIDSPEVQAIDTAYKNILTMRQHALYGAALTAQERALMKDLTATNLGASPMQKLVAVQILYAAHRRLLETEWNQVAAAARGDPLAGAVIKDLVNKAPYAVPKNAADMLDVEAVTLPSAPEPTAVRQPARAPAAAPQAAQAPAQPQQPPVPGARFFKASGKWKVEQSPGVWVEVQ